MDRSSTTANADSDDDREWRRATEKASAQKARRKSLIYITSWMEVLAYSTITMAFLFRHLYEYRYDNLQDPSLYFNLLGSPDVVFTAMLAFISAFSITLNGVSPVISILTRNNRPSERDLDYLIRRPTKRVLIRRTNADGSTEEIHDERNEADDAVPVSASDSVELNFAVYIKRSQEAARVAQRRPNALLMVGSMIAIVGLFFFVATLPGSRFAQALLGDAVNVSDYNSSPLNHNFPTSNTKPSIDPPSPSSSPNLLTKVPTGEDIWVTALQLLPRLLMLIFIQVLAGFFLRQYRTSMEDFRYYESILRHREAQYLSYTLRLRLNDNKALLKFADELLKAQSFGVIMHGQTTTMLEAQRAEVNEFGTLYEKLASHISRTFKKEEKEKVKSEKGQAS